MKKLLVIACSVLCGLSVGRAADQPMDPEPFPEGQYLRLSLSEDQLEEVESRRRITLSKSQLDTLRALAPTFPKRVGVASPFVAKIPDSRFSLWPGQVCAIWYCKDKVVISRDSLDGAEGYREFSSSLNASDAVLIGVQGSYWIGSNKVNREKLIKSLDRLAIKEPEGADFEIFVLRPPVFEDTGEDQAVQRAVNDVIELCQERGLRCQVGG